MDLIDKPKIISYHNIKPVSFSELYSMQDCVLKGFLKSREVVIDYPVHGAVTVDLICGYIFHSLVRDLPKYFTMTKQAHRKAVRVDLESYIDDYAIKYPSFDFSDYRYWQKLAKAIDTVVHKENFAFDDVIGRELIIVSSDTIIVGIIDLIESTNDGIQLIDYKSSSYYSDFGIPERYVQQLHYYALLTEDKFGEYPEKGFIEYFNSERIPVPLDYEYSAKLLGRARSIYSRIEAVNKGETNLESLSNLSDYNCRGCPASYLCPVVHSSILKVDSSFLSSMMSQVVSIQDNSIEILIKSGITCSSANIFILRVAPALIDILEGGVCT